MSITLPSRSFPYWNDPGENQSPPALIIGAGFSTPQVPLPYELAIHYAEQQSEIEKTLGIATRFNFSRDETGKVNTSDDLYCWAGRCIEELLLKAPEAKQNAAKRNLIKAMGLLEDQRFAATANIPLRGTTPRHRVVARLAREGCIHSLWSLNWDLWLESAFEAVGLIRKNSNSTNPRDELPSGWMKTYRVGLSSENLQVDKSCLTLYKPHGCVSAFANGTEDTFKITKDELEERLLNKEQHQLQTQLHSKPVCAIGWGATEGNIQDIFDQLHNSEGLMSGGLTIVSLEWFDDLTPNNRRHLNLATRFGQNKSDTHCSVQKRSPGTTDDLMQWIQALRTLRRSRKVVMGLAPNNFAMLEQIEQQIEVFKKPIFFESSYGWALSWFDTFVPIWSRFCFSLKALVFPKDGDVPVSALPMMCRDEHIPLNDDTTKRWDILSAANLYSILLSMDTAIQSELDFESYPGAFWHKPTRSLLMPIPMWANVADISLAAIKPLMESRHWAGMSKVKTICLLCVKGGSTAVKQPSERNLLVEWKQRICSLMKLGAFARASNIEDCDGLDLQAYLQSKKDAL